MTEILGKGNWDKYMARTAKDIKEEEGQRKVLGYLFICMAAICTSVSMVVVTIRI